MQTYTSALAQTHPHVQIHLQIHVDKVTGNSSDIPSQTRAKCMKPGSPLQLSLYFCIRMQSQVTELTVRISNTGIGIIERSHI